jgi:hypothetical protein
MNQISLSGKILPEGLYLYAGKKFRMEMQAWQDMTEGAIRIFIGHPDIRI